LQSSMMMTGRGRNTTVGLWLDLFDEHATRTLPQLGVAHALHQLAWGDADAVEHWADVAEQALRAGDDLQRGPTDRARLELAVAASRALVGRPNLEAASAHTAFIIDAGPDGNPWWGVANMLEGLARLMMGDVRAALDLLREAERSTDQPHVQILAIAHRAHAELHLGRIDDAVRLVTRAKRLASHNDLDDYLPTVAMVAVAALIEAEIGDLVTARDDALRARRLLTAGHPMIVRTGLLVCARLARAELLLGDHVAARTMVEEGRSYASREPAAHLSIAELDAVDEELRRLEPSDLLERTPADLGPSSLTTAELRVLEYLPTHLSLKEIGEKLYVSRNTVKSQAIATYRKLGVSSRSEAVAAARSLGLIDP
jgi:LuxR family maltose regulon positive regulatory protein